jgi:hypothetical protein
MHTGISRYKFNDGDHAGPLALAAPVRMRNAGARR